jgi:hypothetical protein
MPPLSRRAGTKFTCGKACLLAAHAVHRRILIEFEMMSLRFETELKHARHFHAFIALHVSSLRAQRSNPAFLQETGLLRRYRSPQ